MSFEPLGHMVQVIMLSDMEAIVDPTDTPDDLYPTVAAWITSLSGMGDLSMVAFDPNTLRRRRVFDTSSPLYNTEQYYVLKPEVTIEPDWEYKPTGSKAHIDASVRRKL